MRNAHRRIAVALTLALLAAAIAVAAPARRPPRRDRPRGQNRYTIEQAISDRAQLTTIAFNGLAFLTGELGCDTFIPPGKVCDYFGFQYMRDIDAVEGGHNTSFVSRIADNVMLVLTDAQEAKLAALAQVQAPQLEKLAEMRFPLIKAYRRQLEGDIPAGSDGLSREAVVRYTGDLFEFDGKLSYERARVMGEVVRGFTAEQKAALAKLKFGDSSTWPEQPREFNRRLPRGTRVAFTTYVSEMFSWYAGSVAADTYFCPERHGTYFGGFYMKDMPVMGKRNMNISTSLTGESGEAFIKLLTHAQRKHITALPDLQRKALQEIVDVRRKIAVELRKFMTDTPPDEKTVLALARRYGELDGELAYLYAKAFAEINRTLADAQRAQLVKLRNLEGYKPKGAYLYSKPIAMPAIPDTDFLFGVNQR